MWWEIVFLEELEIIWIYALKMSDLRLIEKPFCFEKYCVIKNSKRKTQNTLIHSRKWTRSPKKW